MKVCATAEDPDGDELAFSWKRQLKSSEVLASEEDVDFQLESHKASGNEATQCKLFPMYVPRHKSGMTRHFKVTVYDLFYDQDKGKKVRAEDWINDAFYDDPSDHISSRASLSFPVHVSCTDRGPSWF